MRGRPRMWWVADQWSASATHPPFQGSTPHVVGCALEIWRPNPSVQGLTPERAARGRPERPCRSRRVMAFAVLLWGRLGMCNIDRRCRSRGAGRAAWSGLKPAGGAGPEPTRPVQLHQYHPPPHASPRQGRSGWLDASGPPGPGTSAPDGRPRTQCRLAIPWLVGSLRLVPPEKAQADGISTRMLGSPLVCQGENPQLQRSSAEVVAAAQLRCGGVALARRVVGGSGGG